MIKSITYEGLLGQKGNDSTIEFNPQLNIITGRNGSGKTTLLKLLWCCISGRFDILTQEIDFTSIEVLTDKATIKISKDQKLFDLQIATEQRTFKPIRNYTLYPIEDGIHSSLYFPSFRRIEGGYTIVPKIGEEVQNNEIYQAFNDLSQRLSSQSSYNHRFVAYVSTNDLDRQVSGEMAFIGTQKDNINKSKDEAILKIAEKGNTNNGIADIIKKAQKELTALEAGINTLHSLVDQHIKKSILLTNKLTVGTTNKFHPIPSQRLSAGEKQLFAFFCYNIFTKNATIFIDEPELSLHPDWQRAFVPLLLEQSSSNQFIMTTHSDFIAALYPEYEIELNKDKGF